MKVAVNVCVPKIVEMEVSFPLYRQHDVSGDGYNSVYYTRIDRLPAGEGGYAHRAERFVHHSIKHDTFPDERFELSVETYLTFGHDKSDADYTLARGQYASSSEAWDKARSKAIAFLEKFPRGVT